MRRHLLRAALLWMVMCAIGEALVWTDLFPVEASSEAKDFDDIFRLLMIVGIPVVTFAIAVLVYSFLVFRYRTGVETGPDQRGEGMVPKVWLAITGALAVGVMIYPGLTGLSELQKGSRSNFGWGDTDAPIVVKATGFQWAWNFEYEGTGVKLLSKQQDELVLPVGTAVKFETTALDVLHSLWIPAFRMRIDVVPGRTTYMTVTPTELGRFEEDEAYRAQCSQLCGGDHTDMSFPVRVVTQQEFQTWLLGKQSKVQVQ